MMVILRHPFLYDIDEAKYRLPAHEFFFETIADYGDRIALYDTERQTTIRFSELKPLAGSIARSLLRDCRFTKGDVVATFIENRPEFFPIFFGVLSLGGIYTGVNPMATPTELHYQLSNSEAKVLITTLHLLDKVKAAMMLEDGIRLDAVYVYDGDNLNLTAPYRSFSQLLAHPTTTFPVVNINAETDVACLFYSSGTTGRPKGVMLAHKNVNWMIYQVPGATGGWIPTEADRMLAIVPFFHVAGFGSALQCISGGAELFVTPKFDAVQFLQNVERYKITGFFCVPSVLVLITRDQRAQNYGLSSLKTIMYGAAPAGAELLQSVIRRLPKLEYLIQLYGMTEAGIWTAMMPQIPKDKAPVVSVGMVQRDTEIKVVATDGSFRELNANEVGEVWVRNNFLMLGYKNLPGATKDAFGPQGWLRSGDIGWFDKAGFLYITDRVKDFIKYKGYQIAPAELEDVILKHPAVWEAAVAGIVHPTDRDIGELPTAFVALSKGHKASSKLTAEIKALVVKNCSPYKHLRGGVIFIDNIPKGPSGKILRRQLRDAVNTGKLKAKM